MKKVFEFLGVVLFLQGVAAVVHELTGWLRGWGVVQHIGFLDGYELYAGIVLVVLAVAVFAAAESRA
ncbi:hypothetical protein [Streptomyces sp. Da 82-17]|uniref:hypothetical protein n=1 Tax=Streptomyces sp. Da 82-17 TaxID=3377116 RepID=UPI0038D3D7E8